MEHIVLLTEWRANDSRCVCVTLLIHQHGCCKLSENVFIFLNEAQEAQEVAMKPPDISIFLNEAL